MAYTKVYRDFKGIDVSSEPSEVDDRRFAHALNVWRDYHSENGEAVETAPGFRILSKITDIYNRAPVRSLHYFPGDAPHILAQIGLGMYAYKVVEKNGLVSLQYTDSFRGTGSFGHGGPAKSIFHYEKLYLVDGESYKVVSLDNEGLKAANVSDSPYIPITYSDGEPYEQRNLLTDKFIEKYNAHKEKLEYVIHEPILSISKIMFGGVDTKLFFVDRGMLWENDTSLKQVTAEDGTVLYKWDASSNILYVGYTTPVSLAHEAFNSFADWNFSMPTGKDPYDSAIITWAKAEHLVDGKTEERIIPVVKYTVKTNVYYAPVTYASDLEITFSDDLGGGKRCIHSIKVKEWSGDAEKELVIEGVADPQKFNPVGSGKDMLVGNPDFQEKNLAVNAINGCTLIEEFDGRIFLSGNPKFPNSIFYTQRNLLGINDPTYIGAYNYINDGTGATPITAMISTPTYLVVLKDDVSQGSSAYYHVGQYNPSDDLVVANLQPRVYPCEQGVPGVGCVGCAVNFLDDPVFLSTKGLEAVGKSQVNLERSIAHRSYLVDAKLINEKLRDAKFAEWDGYLCVLVPGGKMYLADSRQIDSTIHGHRQYEWYLWDGIGVHDEKAERYRYATVMPEGFVENQKHNGVDIGIKGCGGYVDGTPIKAYVTCIIDGVHKSKYVSMVLEEHEGVPCYFIVESYGEMQTKSWLSMATALLSVGGRLFFGCNDGSICVFNTDERDETQKIVPAGYIREREETADGYKGLGYLAEMATKFDHCGRTNLAKSTERGTFVLKAKAYPLSQISVKVRTNRDGWAEVYNGSVSHLNLGEFDFNSLSFNTAETFLVAIRESKRRWVEKQILVQGWCYGSPFGLISATYDFVVAGKVKLR